MKHVIKKTAALLIAAAISTASMAGIEEGAAAYDEKDYATALKELSPLAVAEPSKSDEMLTNALKQALALVDVRVLDHFIVAGASVLSFAERGLL